jgi:hypothetical protein
MTWLLSKVAVANAKVEVAKVAAKAAKVVAKAAGVDTDMVAGVAGADAAEEEEDVAANCSKKSICFQFATN